MIEHSQTTMHLCTSYTSMHTDTFYEPVRSIPTDCIVSGESHWYSTEILTPSRKSGGAYKKCIMGCWHQAGCRDAAWAHTYPVLTRPSSNPFRSSSFRLSSRVSLDEPGSHRQKSIKSVNGNEHIKYWLLLCSTTVKTEPAEFDCSQKKKDSWVLIMYTIPLNKCTVNFLTIVAT